jgi:hypothetical protein
MNKPTKWDGWEMPTASLENIIYGPSSKCGWLENCPFEKTNFNCCTWVILEYAKSSKDMLKTPGHGLHIYFWHLFLHY